MCRCTRPVLFILPFLFLLPPAAGRDTIWELKGLTGIRQPRSVPFSVPLPPVPEKEWNTGDLYGQHPPQV